MPWLEPIDEPLLTAYVTACSIFEQAGGELDRRLQDPAFADPKSKMAKEGVMYSRGQPPGEPDDDACQHTLFTPRGRPALGTK